MQQSDLAKIPWWRNRRVIEIAVQTFVLAIAISIIAWMGNNLSNNLQRLNLNFGFDFLDRAASFAIADPPIEYRPTDPYYRALLVGLLNSLRVMFFGIIIAATLGITVGIGRLSSNWLVRQLASVYVEILRNTPLLLQLFFWYFGVFLRLPKIENPLIVGDRFFLTNRGLDIPWFASNFRTDISLLAIVGCILLATAAWTKRNQAIRTGTKSALLAGNLSLGGVRNDFIILLWH